MNHKLFLLTGLLLGSALHAMESLEPWNDPTKIHINFDNIDLTTLISNMSTIFGVTFKQKARLLAPSIFLTYQTTTTKKNAWNVLVKFLTENGRQITRSSKNPQIFYISDRK